MANNQRTNRLQYFGDIVMEIYLQHPIFSDRGGIIGNGDNDIAVRAFVAQVLEVAKERMNMTQTELADMIGSHVSNWNEWYRQRRRPLPTEGNRTIWFINEIIFIRLEKMVLDGPPPPPWPLRE